MVSKPALHEKEEYMSNSTNVGRIRELNDCLRVSHTGGQVLATSGIGALGSSVVSAILCEVAAFDSFSQDNDPYGEHDCAAITVDGVCILWKIDYYDTDHRFLSPDPSDASVTSRVLTIMLAEEY